jgi:hypothetical protein
MEVALGAVYRERAGGATLEACALSYSHTEGARTVLNKMMAMAELKETIDAPQPRRFRNTND